LQVNIWALTPAEFGSRDFFWIYGHVAPGTGAKLGPLSSASAISASLGTIPIQRCGVVAKVFKNHHKIITNMLRCYENRFVSDTIQYIACWFVKLPWLPSIRISMPIRGMAYVASAADRSGAISKPSQITCIVNLGMKGQ
jgi:hypothetical protein